MGHTGAALVPQIDPVLKSDITMGHGYLPQNVLKTVQQQLFRRAATEAIDNREFTAYI